MEETTSFLSELDQNIDELTSFLDFEVGWFNLREAVFGILLFVFLLLFFRLLRKYLLASLGKLARRTQNEFDDELVRMFADIKPYFYWIVSFYISFRFLWAVNPSLTRFFYAVFAIFIIIFLTRFLQRFILYVLEKMWMKGDDKQAERETAVRGLAVAINIVLWIVAGLLIFVNLGIEIGPLAASLGITGIAVAFALQNVLGDLFSSFSIYFDQPFRIGDYVDVGGGQTGTVKRIGLKTTRIQSLSGEEMVVSNAQLTNSTIRNYKKMRKRRIAFPIGVEYGTASAKLKKIPDIIQKIIEGTENAEFARCHFKSFGDFSLNFEIVYFVTSRDYVVYMDTQQAINLAIAEKFEKEKISIAFPTQTVWVKKN